MPRACYWSAPMTIGNHCGMRLNALLNIAEGSATWMSLHHGGGVGVGYSQHAGYAKAVEVAKAKGLNLPML